MPRATVHRPWAPADETMHKAVGIFDRESIGLRDCELRVEETYLSSRPMTATKNLEHRQLSEEINEIECADQYPIQPRAYRYSMKESIA